MRPPLIAHVMYRFGTGGLENGVVNLINRLPSDGYRHAVIALTDIVPSFAARVRRDDVFYVGLKKPPGHGFRVYRQLVQLLRDLRPAVMHTRNLAALECQLPAWWAGVPVRIHSEHGWDESDPHGSVRRYQWVRRIYSPFVHHFIALSTDLGGYLRRHVGVADKHITQIINGVDVDRFRPSSTGRVAIPGCPFDAPDLFVAGTVGRMQTVKAQPLLARAFVLALAMAPELRQRLRLTLVGDGPLRAEAQSVLEAAGVSSLAWLPGERTDIPEVMQSLNAFVLPSLTEGISNTILEAMACGLPVLATRVGGNDELVDPGVTGELVAAGNVEEMARGLIALAANPDRAAAQGRAGRQRAEQSFSLATMVRSYAGVYERLLAEHGRTKA